MSYILNISNKLLPNFINISLFEQERGWGEMNDNKEGKIINLTETIAYSASNEINKILHDEDSGFFQPWQCISYNTIPNTLKTTLDELFILWDKEARLRTGFALSKGNVYIPNIFSIISGTDPSFEEYWKKVELLKNKKEEVVFISKIPLSKENIASNYAKKYDELKADKDLFLDNGLFNIDRVKQLDFYNFQHLRLNLQDILLNKINQIINIEGFFKFEISEELKFKLLFATLTMDASFISLIQKFDYPFKIPKVVIFDGEKTVFSHFDIFLLAFLYLIGLDIVILSPAGYVNLENFVDEKWYVTHSLKVLRDDINPDVINQNTIRNTSAIGRTSQPGIFDRWMSSFKRK